MKLFKIVDFIYYIKKLIFYAYFHLSPNVWIEKETEGSKFLQATTDGNGDGRPSRKGYFPVLITSGGTTLIDEEKGLVQAQIEYTESHGINTQRT